MIETRPPVSQSFGARNVKVIAKTTTAKTGISLHDAGAPRDRQSFEGSESLARTCRITFPIWSVAGTCSSVSDPARLEPTLEMRDAAVP
jgi:hypothetical protein